MDPRAVATGWEAGDERKRGPEEAAAAGGKRGTEAITDHGAGRS